MGNMMWMALPTAARINARNCTLNNSGIANEMRIARQPKKGFVSLGSVR